MQYYLFTLLLFCCFSVSTQSLSAQYVQEWQQHYGDENIDPFGVGTYPFITSIDQLSNGDFVVGGYDQIIGYWLYQIDENGNLIWEALNNGGEGDKMLGTSFCIAADGGMAMTGQNEGYTGINGPLSVIKTDSLGDFQWQLNYTQPYAENGIVIEPSNDGGFFVASILYNGSFMNNASSSRLLRLDADGNIVWEQQLDFELSVDIAPSSDGGFFYLSFGSSKVYLKKINGDGVIEWENEYDDSDGLFRTGQALTVTAEGEPLILGKIKEDIPDFGIDPNDVWVLKTDQNGNFLWEQSYNINNSDYESPIDIKVKANGNIIVLANYPLGTGSTDFWLAELEENGNLLWETFYEEFQYNVSQTLCLSNDEDILLGGYFTQSADYDEGPIAEDRRPWLIKLHPEGEGLELAAKIFLEGCYNDDGTMSSNLTDVLPLNQPYNIAPWNYTGTESLSTIPSNMVDWVLVEARTGIPSLSSSSTGTTIVEQKAGLLLTDGSIVGLDGVSGLRFLNLTEGEAYYFSIRHRNHLDVLTATEIIGASQMSFDFTTDTEQAFGPDQQKPSIDGKAVLHTGDINADGVIQVTDYDIWFEKKAVLNTYHPADLNLDKVIQTTDYDAWFFNKAKIGLGELQY